jgi:hypothetical protein
MICRATSRETVAEAAEEQPQKFTTFYVAFGVSAKEKKPATASFGRRHKG